MRLFLCPSELLLDGGELWAAEEIQSGGTPIIIQGYDLRKLIKWSK